MRFTRTFGVILLALLSVLLLEKGLDLSQLAHKVDGTGIGISFLGMEIDDRVARSEIHRYAAGFMLAGLVMLSATLVIGFKGHPVREAN
ncbi:hypothetical protein [Bacillus sp. B-jedd]|uniref:hypothetical protein n=1 Tax=Bacillus sp. B-jedd TaxID=1476857 RepID=UPI0005156745|nr:hypothetical protein [Bacillus sp. B-jedd]CEG27256.1 hypothetical protein BN1002_02112 [Bacillus sp. B-jedd]